MAENVQITPGTGVTIGADSVLDGTLGSAQIQYVKIMDGTIGGTNKAAVTANGLAVDGSGVTQPISAVSLPLPSGAATEATLASVDTNTANLDVLLSTRASEATLSSIDSQTSQFSFSVGRLLVDGSGVTQPISGTVTTLQGTSPWVISGTVTVGNASLAVTQSGVWSVGRTWTLGSGSDSVAAAQSGAWTTGRTWTLTSGTDSISAVQSGTWNINNISGTISLPTGASTAANQATANASLSSIDGKTPSLGQATMASSVPVVIASNQSTIPVSLTSTTITGTVAVTQSTSPWVISGTVTSNIGTTNGLALDATLAKLTLAQGSTTAAQTGPLIQGAVTTAAPTYTTAQTSPLSLDTAGNLRVVLSAGSIDIGKVDQGLQGTIAQSWFVELTDGTNVLGTAAHPVRIDPTGTTTQPVNVTNASLSVTQGTSPWVVSLASTTITGTVAVTQSGVWSTGRTWTLASGTDSVAAVQSGTWNINNISGTISLPTGAATEATLATRLADATFTARINTLGQKTMANSTPVVLASDQTAIPASQSGTWNINNISGTISLPTGASTAANQTTLGSQTTKINDGTNTAAVKAASTAAVATDTALVVAISPNNTVASTQSGTWNINNISGTISLPTGAATSANQATANTSLSTIAGAILGQGSTTAGQNGNLVFGAVTTAAPAYTTAQSSPLSLNTAGSLRTDISSWIGSTAPTVGQKTSANSIPVVISSDQTAVPVTLPTSTTGTSTNIARSNANQTFLASNTARKGATVFNDSGSPVSVKLGATASATSFSVIIASQAYYEVPFNYTGIIDGIWGSNGAGAARVTELT